MVTQAHSLTYMRASIYKFLTILYHGPQDIFHDRDRLPVVLLHHLFIVTTIPFSLDVPSRCLTRTAAARSWGSNPGCLFLALWRCPQCCPCGTPTWTASRYLRCNMNTCIINGNDAKMKVARGLINRYLYIHSMGKVFCNFRILFLKYVDDNDVIQHCNKPCWLMVLWWGEHSCHATVNWPL